GVPLQAEQADWLEDTDEEIDEQELEAHYSYMAKIQEVSPANVRRYSEQPKSINDTYVLEKDDSDVILDSSNICTNDNQVDQNAVECVDERAALANLIANLTLDTEENKTILKSTFANPKYLKKAQSEKPCLYEIPYDTSDPANRFCPNGEETVTLENESRSKLNKDTLKTI
ncbi:hypothetical protein Tco_0518941, partial [Tanacetum coccineum]